MPSGYTAALYEGGGDVTLSDFILNCARAFGALVELRDDPNASIPDKFEAGDYHVKMVAKAQKQLGKIRQWSDEEAEKKAKSSFRKAHQRYVKTLVEKNEIWYRYEQMLDKVRAWEPPTPDHKELKKFMIEQLEQGIKWDCAHSLTPPVKQSGAEYKKAEMDAAVREIDYHIEQQRNDEERAQNRTEWVRALRESLEESSDAVEA